MRAAILPAYHEKLEVYDDVEVVGPGPGEVLCRVAATGVCHSDLSYQRGVFPNPVPGVVGHEGAGEILALGEGVTGLNVGDHVIFAFLPPCGACLWCLNGQPQLCLTMVAQGAMAQRFRRGEDLFFPMSGLGTFAEQVVVQQQACIVIPPDIPLDIASLIGCGVTTGVGAALNTAQVRPGSSVVVIGCGGVGISIIQGARIAGAAEIVAVDMFENKIEMAKKFGATHGATPDQLPAVSAEITNGFGFDYAFEALGSPTTIRSAWDNTRRGGTTVVVGVGRAEDTVPFNAYEFWFMERTFKGSCYGSADVRTDFHRLLRLWRTGKLDLEGMITRRIDLSEINEAFDAMERGEVIRQVIEFK
jgi:S-(hydroxymethyl)glutathione dehydrogenase/alcohol dehydrogenase